MFHPIKENFPLWDIFHIGYTRQEFRNDVKRLLLDRCLEFQFGTVVALGLRRTRRGWREEQVK